MAYRVISLEASEELSRLGISHRALSEIFLGPDNVDTRIDLVANAPSYAKDFAEREDPCWRLFVSSLARRQNSRARPMDGGDDTLPMRVYHANPGRTTL